MRRRQAATALFAICALPWVAQAQRRGRRVRVGYLGAGSRATLGYNFDAFRQAMRELGYVEGESIAYDDRWGEGRPERLPGLAKELVALHPDVILVGNITATLAVKQATETLPIVMATSVDPVGAGVVKSLARPGGNITGLSNMAIELGPKLFELILAVVPQPSRVAVLVNPANPGHAKFVASVQADARAAGVAVLEVRVQIGEEIEDAIARMAHEKVGAAIVALDALFNQHTRRIAELARSRRLTTIGGWPQYAEAGGLMSYGQNLVDNFRRAASYVDRILKGAKPADLPIEQPTRLELVINLKAAKALGIKVPQSILARADRVIE